VPISDRAREIRAEVEKILGLDYDGFTRSVVLPQGQFDSFLKGEPKERGRSWSRCWSRCLRADAAAREPEGVAARPRPIS